MFRGLIRFSEVLARARRRWEADHGMGLAEIYAERAADLDSDDEFELVLSRRGPHGGGFSSTEEGAMAPEDPLIERLKFYISIGVASEQLERDLASVKGAEGATKLLKIAGSRASFALPQDLAENDATRLGVAPEQAALWAREWDELEADEDDSFEYYADMVSRGVPHAAVAARLERDGEDDETIALFAQLYAYRRHFGPPLGVLDEEGEEEDYEEEEDESGSGEHGGVVECS